MAWLRFLLEHANVWAVVVIMQLYCQLWLG